MKRFTAILLSVFLLMTMLSCVVLAAGPIEIKTAADLSAVRNDLKADYVLKNDIAFSANDFKSGGAFYNGGKGFLPIGSDTPFSGTFDGGGHTVSGLVIAAKCVDDDDSLYAGLFGSINGTVDKQAVIKNLHLTDCKVNFTIPETVSGDFMITEADIGGICGFIGNYSLIERCSVSGSISATVAGSGTVKIGSVVGGNFGTVSNCCGTASVTATADAKVYAGGVLGYQHGTVTNCWGNAVTTGSAVSVFCGTVIGYSVKADVSGCYYADHGVKPIGKAKAAETATCLTLPTTAQKLVGWDMTTVWAISQSGEPILRTACKHTATHEVVTKQPNCINAGTKNIVCDNCGTVISANLPISETGIHIAGVWKVVKQPTESETGLSEQRCTICKALLDSKVLPIISSKDAAKDFVDVSKKDWFYPAVNYAYNANLFGGISKTKFAPNDNMTRAMFVTVLGRLNGVKVDHNQPTKFTDVPTGQWYTGYVKWASDKGIVSGISKTKFAPNANVTREQICKMMVEYCSYVKIKLKAVNAPVTFADASKISGWAKEYVKKCQTSGLVGGSVRGGKTYFDPQGNATRAQVAQILYNFNQNYLQK